MSELKRCPKCGYWGMPSALDYGMYFPDKMAFGVCCFNLECNHQVGWFATPEEAEEAWNRRVGEGEKG